MTRRNIAKCLLFAFSIVFVCDFLCDLEILDVSIGGHHSHKVEKPIDKNEPGHHHPATDVHKHGNTHEDNHVPGNEDDGCCEEETNQLYASLVKHETPKLDLEKVPVLFYAEYLNTISNHFTFYKEHNPNGLKSALSPPVDGRFTRILYQSFLC